MIFPWGDHRPDDPEGALWDIVVIGAGLGGGLLGSALAQNGLKTLFLERGPAVSPVPRGRRSIRTRRFLSEAELASRGRWGAHALRVADIITREWWPDRWTAQSCRR